MKKKYIIIIVIILLPILIFKLGRFHFDEYYLIGRDIPVKKISTIKCGFWKIYDGRCLVDFFDNDNIKNDTLYITGIPQAKIISIVHRCFLNDYILTMQCLDGQDTVFYISK